MASRLRNFREFLKPEAENINEIEMVTPTGFEPVLTVRHAL